MRSIILRSAVIAAALATSLTGAAQAPDYTQILAEARQALGGEARLDAIRTFHAKGNIEVGSDREATRTYGSFDVVSELPDKFLATDDRAYQSTGDGAKVDIGTTFPYGGGAIGPSSSVRTSTIGFNGPSAIYQQPFTSYMDANSRFRVPPPATTGQLDAALNAARNDFVQWTMGLFASTFGVSSSIQLQIDPGTHLPSRLGTLEYFDYRKVDGLLVPFRLQRVLSGTTGWKTVWTVRQFTYNVPVSAKTFEPTQPVK